jgi:hypothetical protein
MNHNNLTIFRIAFWWQCHQCDVYWLRTFFFYTMSHCFAIEVIFICHPLVNCIIALNVFLHMCLCMFLCHLCSILLLLGIFAITCVYVFVCFIVSFHSMMLFFKYVACFVVSLPFVMLHTQCWICNQCTNIASTSTPFPHLSPPSSSSETTPLRSQSI